MIRSGLWAMGGYARFVWPSIGFTLGVLAWNVWSARRHHARSLPRLRRAIEIARSEEP